MRLLAVAVLACGFAAPTAAAEFDISTVIVPSVDAGQQTIDAVEQAVKDNAGVLSLSIEGSSTLADIVAEECPGATEGYLASLLEDVVTLNPGLFEGKDVSLQQRIGGKGYDVTTLYIPYCLGAFAEKYVVQQGDSLWTIYDQQRGQQNGISDWQSFVDQAVRLNGEAVEAGGIESGTVLALPTAEWQVPVAADKAGTLVEQLNSIDPIQGKVMLENAQNWGKANQEDETSCANVSELEALNGAERRLWAVADTLMLNDALDEEHTLRREKAVVDVAILDSGVSAPRHPAMKRLLKPLTTERDGFAFADDPRGFHGTGVLFTAAGGYMLSALNPLGVPVRTAAYNLYRSLCSDPANCQYIADPNRLQAALRAAFDRRTDTVAVNISVSFAGDDPLPWFVDYLGTDKEVLVVTSAGNDGQEIGDATRIYPAIYGGKEASNIITVASLDLGGELLPLSNFSREVVDIAAWGCNVPVAEFDPKLGGFVRKLRSGTSYAAPQVLYGSAMLLRERPRRSASALSPSELKIRLVTSADHSLQLWDKVRHGRVLNLAKALSVHTDLVQLKDGSLLRGRLDFGGSGEFVDVCGDQSVKRRDLLSIANLGRAPEPGTQPILIYRRSASVAGDVETRWCNALTADMTLIDPFTEEPTPISNSDVASIVLATYPYWED